jgi:hypothetical protein
MTYPTPAQAEEAAELLGVDVFDLAHALHEYAVGRYQSEIDRVKQYERPNFGLARRLQAASAVAFEAWEMVAAARAESPEQTTT